MKQQQNDSLYHTISEAQECVQAMHIIDDMYAADAITLDDKGFSSIFANIFKNKLRYNVTANKWFYYDGKRWIQDNGEIYAQRFARNMSEILSIYALRIKDNTKYESFAKSALKYGRLRYREVLVRDAKSLLAVEQTDFDASPNLLNLSNCTFDLDTMQTHKHRPEDMLTKLSPTEYNPNADRSQWLAFLHDIFQEDEKKIKYVQKICGYALTANTELETIFLLYGPTTRNGKSTFIESFAHMLGNYAATAQPETIAIGKNRKGGAASPDLARLVGVRFLSISEPPQKMLLDVSLIKQLTGGDMITARNLYQSPFEFKPEFKLMINTNNLPTVTDNTLFSSERVRIITFDRHFEKFEQNPHLKQELLKPETQSAILNWALEGLQKYRLEGEQPPECVLNATADFKKTSDKILKFFDDCMEKSDSNTSGSDVYTQYKSWCNNNNYASEKKGEFFAALRERNLLAKTATIAGKTVRNVVAGYKIIN